MVLLKEIQLTLASGRKFNTMHAITWPEAFVIVVGIIGAVVALISFIIAASGSRFPWEK